MTVQRPLPWSLKGVSRNARDAARAAAQREGVPLGVWLSRVIREVAAAEAATADTDGSADTDAGNGNPIQRGVARLPPSAAAGPRSP